MRPGAARKMHDSRQNESRAGWAHFVLAFGYGFVVCWHLWAAKEHWDRIPKIQENK